MLEPLLSQEPVSFSYVQAFGMSFLSELVRTLKWSDGSDGEMNILMWRRLLNCSSICQDPNIKVYEVADQVGIQTSAYFTYLFKRMVGCTPQEYRNYHYSIGD